MQYYSYTTKGRGCGISKQTCMLNSPETAVLGTEYKLTFPEPTGPATAIKGFSYSKNYGIKHVSSITKQAVNLTLQSLC